MLLTGRANYGMLPKNVLLMSLSQFKCYIFNINLVIWHRGINSVIFVFIMSFGLTNNFLLLLLLLLLLNNIELHKISFINFYNATDTILLKNFENSIAHNYIFAERLFRCFCGTLSV